MTVQEAQQRTGKAQNLRVFKVDNTFYVESSEGKVCYSITTDKDKGVTCACGDYARGVKSDPAFRCKHILAVLQCNGSDLVNTEYLTRKKHALDERFIKNIKGKDFAVYAGVLDLAHQMGLAELKAIPTQYPTKENDMRAICTSYARTSDGRVFEDVGDADPRNTDTVISKHIIRMASTRAKARVLRDLTNIGMTCLEELGNLDEIAGNDVHDKTVSRISTVRKNEPIEPLKKVASINAVQEQQQESAVVTEIKPKSAPEKPKENPRKAVSTQTPSPKGAVSNESPVKTNSDDLPKLSEAQKKAILNLARRRGLSEEDLKTQVNNHYSVSLEELTIQDASAFIRTLQQAA
ncbi:MAG: hypothetical protein ABFD12_04325 [Syntrophorhabdus sp.]